MIAKSSAAIAIILFIASHFYTQKTHVNLTRAFEEVSHSEKFREKEYDIEQMYYLLNQPNPPITRKNAHSALKFIEAYNAHKKARHWRNLAGSASMATGTWALSDYFGKSTQLQGLSSSGPSSQVATILGEGKTYRDTDGTVYISHRGELRAAEPSTRETAQSVIVDTTGKLFVAIPQPDDGSCGYHSLGISRTKAAEQLIAVIYDTSPGNEARRSAVIENIVWDIHGMFKSKSVPPKILTTVPDLGNLWDDYNTNDIRKEILAVQKALLEQQHETDGTDSTTQHSQEILKNEFKNLKQSLTLTLERAAKKTTSENSVATAAQSIAYLINSLVHSEKILSLTTDKDLRALTQKINKVATQVLTSLEISAEKIAEYKKKSIVDIEEDLPLHIWSGRDAHQAAQKAQETISKSLSFVQPEFLEEKSSGLLSGLIASLGENTLRDDPFNEKKSQEEITTTLREKLGADHPSVTAYERAVTASREIQRRWMERLQETDTLTAYIGSYIKVNEGGRTFLSVPSHRSAGGSAIGALAHAFNWNIAVYTPNGTILGTFGPEKENPDKYLLFREEKTHFEQLLPVTGESR